MSFAENLKALVSFASKAKDPELMDQVMRLQQSMLSLQDDNTRLREKVLALEKERDELEKKVLTKESLAIENGVYFAHNGVEKDGPYCTRCWDVDSKLVRLKVNYNGYATCPNCDTGFNYRHKTSPAADTIYNPFA